MKIVKRRTSSSAVISFFNAGDRDFEMTILERRLIDIQRSILASWWLTSYKPFPHSYDIATLGNGRSADSEYILYIIATMSPIQSVVKLQSIRQSMNATYSAVLEGITRHIQTMPLGGDDPDACFVIFLLFTMNWCSTQIRTYTREDIQILQTIGQYEWYLHPDSVCGTVTVKLHKAERYDNRIFLIKTYHNVPSTWKAEAVCLRFSRSQTVVDPYYSLCEISVCVDESCELQLASAMPENNWLFVLRDPSLLQLVGASRTTAAIPFQVFHLQGGLLQPYATWVKQTLSFNPVEAVYGMYKMVCCSPWCVDHW